MYFLLPPLESAKPKMYNLCNNNKLNRSICGFEDTKAGQRRHSAALPCFLFSSRRFLFRGVEMGCRAAFQFLKRGMNDG